jgi:hypothetical protein
MPASSGGKPNEVVHPHVKIALINGIDEVLLPRPGTCRVPKGI